MYRTFSKKYMFFIFLKFAKIPFNSSSVIDLVLANDSEGGVVFLPKLQLFFNLKLTVFDINLRDVLGFVRLRLVLGSKYIGRKLTMVRA